MNALRVFRVAAPSIRIVPWAALASCWPLPQQLLPVSATGGGRRRCSGKNIYNFAILENLRIFPIYFFTGGVVEGNGICSAAFCESAALRESFLALSGANAPALPRGEPLAWRYSFRLKCKVYGLARASPFGRGGTAYAVTERASPFENFPTEKGCLPDGRQPFPEENKENTRPKGQSEYQNILSSL